MESASRQLDPLVAAASGGGEYCPEGIPVELGFLSILAAFGVAFGILYRALTVKTGRRRKRSELGEEEGSCQAEDIQGLVTCRLGLVLGGSQGTPWASIADILWHGESLVLIYHGPALQIYSGMVSLLFSYILGQYCRYTLAW